MCSGSTPDHSPFVGSLIAPLCVGAVLLVVAAVGVGRRGPPVKARPVLGLHGIYLREVFAAKRNKVAHAHRGRHIFEGQNFSAEGGDRKPPRSRPYLRHCYREELANIGARIRRCYPANVLVADAPIRRSALGVALRISRYQSGLCGVSVAMLAALPLARPRPCPPLTKCPPGSPQLSIDSPLQPPYRLRFSPQWGAC